MTTSKEERLSLAIDEARAGRSSVEAELVRHPELAAEEPLLRLGAAIHAPADAVLAPAFRRQTRAMLLEEARARSVTDSPLRRILWLTNLFGKRRAGMPAILTLIVALALALGGGGLYAAQAAVPGDALYPLKAGLEQAEVALSQGDEALIRTHLRLAERRLDELEAHGGQIAHAAELHLGANALSHLELAAQTMERYAAAGNDAGEHQARLGADLGRYEAWRLRSGAPEVGSPQLRGLLPHEPAQDRLRERDQLQQRDQLQEQDQAQEQLREQDQLQEQLREREQLQTGEGQQGPGPGGNTQQQQGQPESAPEPAMEQHQAGPGPSPEPGQGSASPQEAEPQSDAAPSTAPRQGQGAPGEPGPSGGPQHQQGRR